MLVGAAATSAQAGGIERTFLPLGALFEEGSYAELSFSGALPDVSGTASAMFGGFESGDMTVGYGNVGAAYKDDLTEELSLGIFFNEPYGANIGYPGGTNYYAQSATAELDTNALTAILKYDFPNAVSVYGGIRYQTLSAQADLPYVGLGIPGVGPVGYTADGDQDEAWGYIVGVAYERPEIALRVGLTYASAIDHELDVQESSPVFGLFLGTQDLNASTNVTTPQSVTLDFQTGIAEDTLLFGAVRWVDWTEFVINPEGYSQLPYGPLVDYADDRWTYSIGVGRRLNEMWSVAGSIAYEPSTGSITGNLGPTDGFTAVGVGVTYEQANVSVTTGIRYVWLGDAETPQGSDFEDNTAIGGGITIGYNF